MEQMGVWQGVAVDYLKFYPGPPCPTLLRPMGGLSLKRPSFNPLGTPRRTPLRPADGDIGEGEPEVMKTGIIAFFPKFLNLFFVFVLFIASQIRWKKRKAPWESSQFFPRVFSTSFSLFVYHLICITGQFSYDRRFSRVPVILSLLVPNMSHKTFYSIHILFIPTCETATEQTEKVLPNIPFL
jgi:hypothetical protein